MLPNIRNQRIKSLLLAIKHKFPILRYFWALLSFPLGRSSLHQLGWFKSARKMSSIDENGDPVPWLNYPAIHFLKQHTDSYKKLDLWEFGSGNSTIWWSRYFKNVTSVEYDKSWLDLVKKQVGNNVQFIFNEVNSEYPRTILKQSKKYDVVVVDGRMRVDCAINASKRIKPGGVIVWDNTDRERYIEGIQYLYKSGFKSIDFWGPAPIDNYLTQTSIFYKNNNFLNI